MIKYKRYLCTFMAFIMLFLTPLNAFATENIDSNMLSSEPKLEINLESETAQESEKNTQSQSELVTTIATEMITEPVTEVETETFIETETEPETTERETQPVSETETETETEIETETESETIELETEIIFNDLGAQRSSAALKTTDTVTIQVENNRLDWFKAYGPGWFSQTKPQVVLYKNGTTFKDGMANKSSYCLYSSRHSPEGNYHPGSSKFLGAAINYALYYGNRAYGETAYNSKYSAGDYYKDYYITSMAIHYLNGEMGNEPLMVISDEHIASLNDPVASDMFQKYKLLIADSKKAAASGHDVLDNAGRISNATYEIDGTTTQDKWKIDTENGGYRTKNNFKVKVSDIYAFDSIKGVKPVNTTTGESEPGTYVKFVNNKINSSFYINVTDAAYKRMQKNQTKLKIVITGTTHTMSGTRYDPENASSISGDPLQPVTFMEWDTEKVDAKLATVYVEAPEAITVAGKVKVIKKDSETNENLSGAIFTVYQWSNNSKTWNKHSELSFDNRLQFYQSGELKETADNSGKFKVEETTPPPSYQAQSPKWSKEFTVKDSEFEFEFSLTNTHEKTDIAINKTDELTGKTLAGAVYGIYKDQACTVKVSEVGPTNDKGYAKSPKFNRDQKTYYLKELKAPDKFELSTEVRAVDTIATSTTVVGATANFTDKGKPVYIEINKTSASTGHPLAGAVFGVYKEQECTTEVARIQPTNSNGIARSNPFYKTQDVYFIKEITAPNGFIVNPEVFSATVSYDQTTTVNVTDKEVKANVSGMKLDKDRDKNVPQADATLKGAIYGIYAKEDIVHPDGHTGVIYSKDSLIASTETAEDGSFSFKDLFLGKYFVKEIEPSYGYTLDPTLYPVECTYAGQDVPVVEQEVTVFEKIKKQAFELVKVSTDGTTGETELLYNAGFKIFLISDLAKVKDGTLKPSNGESYTAEDFKDYDFTEEKTATDFAEDKEGKEIPELFTDEKGFLRSPELAFGEYIVIESTLPEGDFIRINPFLVSITEDSREPQPWRILNDAHQSTYLKIVKIDAETGKPVLKAGTKYRIFDMKKEQYVIMQTSSGKVGTEENPFVTTEKGYIVTPNKLQSGKYRIDEVQAPSGYVTQGYEGIMNAGYESVEDHKWEKTPTQPIIIEFDSNTPVEVEPGTDNQIFVIKVEQKNVQQYGKLSLYKFGKDLDESDLPLSGAKFELRAAQDIMSQDNQGTVIYKKDELVKTLVSDEKGQASADMLPIGTYSLKEVEAPSGFVLNPEEKIIEIKPGNHQEPFVYVNVDLENKRQNVEINLVKKDAGDKKVLPGAEFGLFAEKDILDAKGNVVYEKDQLLQSAVTDQSGKATFSKNIPNAEFYLKELKAPSGYATLKDKIKVDATYKDPTKETEIIEVSAENHMTQVEFSKQDVTTGKELTGAHIEVYESENGKPKKKIDSWISDANKKHIIKGLKVGQEYVMRETIAPENYKLTTDVVFKIQDTEKIQKVVMKDEKKDEKKEPGKITASTPGNGGSSGTIASKPVKTGDTTDILLFVLMSIISGGTLIFLFYRKRSKQKI